MNDLKDDNNKSVNFLITLSLVLQFYNPQYYLIN